MGLSALFIVMSSVSIVSQMMVELCCKYVFVFTVFFNLFHYFMNYVIWFFVVVHFASCILDEINLYLFNETCHT